MVEQFISGFLGLHNVDRALVSEHPKFNVWYYYLLIVPLFLTITLDTGNMLSIKKHQLERRF